MWGLPEIAEDTAAKLPSCTHPGYQPPTVPVALISRFSPRCPLLLDLVSVIGDAALPERADRLRQGMTLLAFVQSDLTAGAESGGRKLRDHMERNLRRL